MCAGVPGTQNDQKDVVMGSWTPILNFSAHTCVPQVYPGLLELVSSAAAVTSSSCTQPLSPSSQPEGACLLYFTTKHGVHCVLWEMSFSSWGKYPSIIGLLSEWIPNFYLSLCQNDFVFILNGFLIVTSLCSFGVHTPWPWLVNFCRHLDVCFASIFLFWVFSFMFLRDFP